MGLILLYHGRKNSQELLKIEVTKLKIIPLNKQSKKAQREFYAKQRGDWNGVKPVTRVVESKKVYDRKKNKSFEI